MSQPNSAADHHASRDDRDWQVQRYLLDEMTDDERSVFEAGLAGSAELALLLAENTSFLSELKTSGITGNHQPAESDASSNLGSDQGRPLSRTLWTSRRAWVGLALAGAMAGVLLLGPMLSRLLSPKVQPWDQHVQKQPARPKKQVDVDETHQLAAAWLDVRRRITKPAHVPSPAKIDSHPTEPLTTDWVDAIDDDSVSVSDDRLAVPAGPPDWLRAAAQLETPSVNPSGARP